MAPSSSGPGHLVLIQEIAGSNPAGVTTKVAHFGGLFLWLVSSRLEARARVRSSKGRALPRRLVIDLPPEFM
jgi:hypothetical protein